MNKKKQDDENESAPEPFYHATENFASAYFGKVPDHLLNEGKPVDKQVMSSIISLVSDPRNKELKAEALAILRNRDARQLLVDMLHERQYVKYRKELLITCWETGLDFSPWLEVFVDFLFDENPEIVLEAVTVIEEMTGKFTPESVEKSVARLAKFPTGHAMYPMISAIHQKLAGEA